MYASGFHISAGTSSTFTRWLRSSAARCWRAPGAAGVDFEGDGVAFAIGSSAAPMWAAVQPFRCRFPGSASVCMSTRACRKAPPQWWRCPRPSSQVELGGTLQLDARPRDVPWGQTGFPWRRGGPRFSGSPFSVPCCSRICFQEQAHHAVRLDGRQRDAAIRLFRTGLLAPSGCCGPR